MYPKFKEVFTIGSVVRGFYTAPARFTASEARIFHTELYSNFVKIYARVQDDETVLATQVYVSEDYGSDTQYYLDWLRYTKKVIGVPLRNLGEMEIA